MEENASGGGFGAFLDGIIWLVSQIAFGFYNLVYALTHPASWLNWADKEAVMRTVYFGGSVEFFFAVFNIFVVLFLIGLWKREFLWNVTWGLEAFANVTGRFFAWAGLIMVIQQIVIVFMQRIFAASEISLGFGKIITYDVSWWSEELKLYNGLVVCLCCSYAFVQGAHVRVDLIYATVSFRTKRIIDMVGSLLFMVPTAIIIWMYAWYFLWRHLIVPKPSATDTLDGLLNKSRALRWNIETIAFSPNGFNAYFLFKVLLVLFAGMIFIHGIAFFYRSYLEWREGEEAEGKYLDKDTLGDGEEAYEGTH